MEKYLGVFLAGSHVTQAIQLSMSNRPALVECHQISTAYFCIAIQPRNMWLSALNIEPLKQPTNKNLINAHLHSIKEPDPLPEIPRTVGHEPTLCDGAAVSPSAKVYSGAGCKRTIAISITSHAGS